MMKEYCLAQFKEQLGTIISSHYQAKDSNLSALDLAAVRLGLFACEELGPWPLSLVERYHLFDSTGAFDRERADLFALKLCKDKLSTIKGMTTFTEHEQVFYALSFALARESMSRQGLTRKELEYVLSDSFFDDFFERFLPTSLTFSQRNTNKIRADLLLQLSGSLKLGCDNAYLLAPDLSLNKALQELRSAATELFVVGSPAKSLEALYRPTLTGRVEFKPSKKVAICARALEKCGRIEHYELILPEQKAVRVFILGGCDSLELTREERVYLKQCRRSSLAHKRLFCGPLNNATTRELIEIVQPQSIQSDQELLNSLYGKRLKQTTDDERAPLTIHPRPFANDLLSVYAANLAKDEQTVWLDDSFSGLFQLFNDVFCLTKQKPSLLIRGQLILQALAESFSATAKRQEWFLQLEKMIEDLLDELGNYREKRLFFLAVKLKVIESILLHSCQKRGLKEFLFPFMQDITNELTKARDLLSEGSSLVSVIYKSALAIFERESLDGTVVSARGRVLELSTELITLTRGLVQTNKVDRASVFIDKLRLKLLDNQAFEPNQEEQTWFNKLKDSYVELVKVVPIGASTIRNVIDEGYALSCSLLLKEAVRDLTKEGKEECLHPYVEVISLLCSRQWQGQQISNALKTFKRLEKSISSPPVLELNEDLALLKIAPMIKRRKQNTQFLLHALQEADEALQSYCLEHFSSVRERVRLKGSAYKGESFYQQLQSRLEQADSDQQKVEWFTMFISKPLLHRLKEGIRDIIDAPLCSLGKDNSLNEQLLDAKKRFLLLKKISKECAVALALLFPLEGEAGLENGFSHLEALTNKALLKHEAGKVISSFSNILSWIDGMALSGVPSKKGYLDAVGEKFSMIEPALSAMRENVLSEPSMQLERQAILSGFTSSPLPTLPGCQKEAVDLFSVNEKKRLSFLIEYISKTIQGFALLEQRSSELSRRALLKNRERKDNVAEKKKHNDPPQENDLQSAFLPSCHQENYAASFLKKLLNEALFEETRELSNGFREQLENFFINNAYHLPKDLLHQVLMRGMFDFKSRLQRLLHGSAGGAHLVAKVPLFKEELSNALVRDDEKLNLWQDLPVSYQVKIMLAVEAFFSTRDLPSLNRKELLAHFFKESFDFYYSLYLRRDICSRKVINNVLLKLVANSSELSGSEKRSLLLFISKTLEQSQLLALDVLKLSGSYHPLQTYQELTKWGLDLITLNSFLQQEDGANEFDFKLYSIQWALKQKWSNFSVSESGLVWAKAKKDQDALLLSYLNQFAASSSKSCSALANRTEMMSHYQGMRESVLSLYHSLQRQFSGLNFARQFKGDCFLSQAKSALAQRLTQEEVFAILNFSKCLHGLTLQKNRLVPSDESQHYLNSVRELIKLTGQKDHCHSSLVTALSKQQKGLIEKFLAEQRTLCREDQARSLFGFLKLSFVDYNKHNSLAELVNHARGTGRRLSFWSTGERSYQTMKRLGWLDEEKNIIAGSELGELIEKTKSINL